MADECSHIVALRKCDFGPRLFCADAESFEALAASFPAIGSFYGLHIDFTEMDSTHSVEMLAQSFLRQISELQPDGPYFLLGYSFGGLIVYETAARLKDRGQEVQMLALFDTDQPGFRHNLSLEESDAARKAYLKDRMQKYLNSLKRGRLDHFAKDLALVVNKKLQKIYWRLGAHFARALRIGPRNVSKLQKIDTMWNAYVPKPIAQRLLLIRAQGRDAEFGNDPTMGWGRTVQQDVDVRYVSGIHETMMQPPHVEEFVGLLRPHLGR